MYHFSPLNKLTLSIVRSSVGAADSLLGLAYKCNFSLAPSKTTLRRQALVDAGVDDPVVSSLKTL